MFTAWGDLPPLPEIGHPETYYAKQVARADRLGMRHAHEAFKVGQYITLALGSRLTWEQKSRYFRHAIRSHCNGPDMAPHAVMKFYSDLADLVRRHAGGVTQKELKVTQTFILRSASPLVARHL
jgi:hypothetical protein